MDKDILLFVYGLFRKSLTLNLALCREKYFGEFKTKPIYSLLNISDEFPALRKNGTTSVVGDLYLCPQRTLKFIDKLHDYPHTFYHSIITLEDGSSVTAHAIAHNKIPNKIEEIECGDWIKWVKSARSREKEKKEKFKSLMLKGKKDAEERRSRLDQIINSHQAPSSTNKNNLSGRYWDPIKKTWFFLAQKERHITSVTQDELRGLLSKSGLLVSGLTNVEVIQTCINKFGIWY